MFLGLRDQNAKAFKQRHVALLKEQVRRQIFRLHKKGPKVSNEEPLDVKPKKKDLSKAAVGFESKKNLKNVTVVLECSDNEDDEDDEDEDQDPKESTAEDNDATSEAPAKSSEAAAKSSDKGEKTKAAGSGMQLRNHKCPRDDDGNDSEATVDESASKKAATAAGAGEDGE